MRILLIGAPGAGKGTQAVAISERFGIAHNSSGDLLRKHVDDGTSIGRAAKEYLARGDLVPDAVVMDMLYKPVVAATQAGSSSRSSSTCRGPSWSAGSPPAGAARTTGRR